MLRLAVLVACLAACGRFGFGDMPDGTDSGSGANDAMVDAVSTGAVGPRWIATFTNDGSNHAAGTVGDVQLISRMTQGPSFTATPGGTLTAQGFVATALVHWDATGAFVSSTVLDATGFCDMRGIGYDGPDLLLAGLTGGGGSVPAYGACSIITNRQDPVAIRVNPQGQQTLEAHWLASTANGQAWCLAVMPDHTLTITGIYAGGLQVGSTALPTAMTDPSLWAARTQVGTPTQASWARGFTAGSEIHAGPIETSGDEVCMTGGYKGAPNVFGTVLPVVGGYDTWVARVDGTGTARFVRGFGSTGNEPSFGEGSLVAEADGGCTVGLISPADLTVDSMTFPVSLGSGLAVRFAANGSVTWGRRFPATPFLVHVGSRLIAAYTVSSPIMIGTMLFTPNGTDVVVVDVDTVGTNDKLLGVVGGAGQQLATDLSVVGPDALAIMITTQGGLTFGTNASDSGVTILGAVAVLGI